MRETEIFQATAILDEVLPGLVCPVGTDRVISFRNEVSEMLTDESVEKIEVDLRWSLSTVFGASLARHGESVKETDELEHVFFGVEFAIEEVVNNGGDRSGCGGRLRRLGRNGSRRA